MRDLTIFEEPTREYSMYDEELEFFHGYEEEFNDNLLNEFEIVPPTDSRQRITNTKKIPFCWICTIIPTFLHPSTGRPIQMKKQPATGFLIGSKHILTAAHVLFPTDGPLKNQRPIQVKVTPGHNGNSKPFGDYLSTKYKCRSEWRRGGKNYFNPSYDFAVIKLPSSIENKGLKYWGAPGTKTYKFPISKNWLKGRVVNVSGYPRDKRLYSQWLAYDILNNPQPTKGGTKVKNLFTYKADTCLGQSGSPVWWWNGSGKRYLVGIHTGFCDSLDGCYKKSGIGCLPGSSRWSHNTGVLFTHQVQNKINYWIKNL